MANRAFRRMVEQRRSYLNYQSPMLEQYESKFAEQEVPSKEPELEQQQVEANVPVMVPQQTEYAKVTPSAEYEVLVYREKLVNLCDIWGNYKERFYNLIESDDERFDDLFEYHRTIEKILSEKP